MKQRTIHRLITGLLVVAAMLVMVPVSAFAIGTAANTDITNTPTVQYSVGGVAQPLYTAPTTTFVVDRKIIFTIQDNNGGAPVNVPPSSTNQVLNFQLSNESNASVWFKLTAVDLASGQTATLGGNPYNDSGVDTTARVAFVDANGNSAYDAGEEYVQVGSAVGAAVTVNVLVYSSIPAAANGSYINILVTASAVDDNVLPDNLLAEDAADTNAGMETVLADGAGTDDGARSATFTDRHAYRVAAAVISVSKTATTIWDPYNYGAGGVAAPGNPKAIPGSLVQYEITISNAAGGASAIISTVTDTLSVNVAIDPDLKVAADTGPLAALADGDGGLPAVNGFSVTGGGATNTRAIAGAPAYFTTANDGDGVDHNAGVITAILTTVLPAEGTYAVGELKQSESVTIRFNVVVQ